MQKLTKTILIICVMISIFFTLSVYAATLDNISVNLTGTVVKSGETETVDIQFGQNLGSYTVDISYDNSLFEYVSSQGGTANDNGTRVRVYYFDQTGGNNPKNNMQVNFKAKEVTASTNTSLSVTASGLANADASVTYDDITTPIVRNVTIEPNIVPNDENETNNKVVDNQENTSKNNTDNTENTKTAQSNLPSTMPKTGNTAYLYIVPMLIFLISLYLIIRNKIK